jgi:cell division protein FtsL
MESGQLMVVLIVAIVMVASIIKARVKWHYQHHNPNGQMVAENRRLHSEVEELKERIKVLERITVDKENSLAKEIESLRDR